MTCTNNLKQIGLSLHNYHDACKAFPSRQLSFKTTSRVGVYGVTLVLLPYCEQTGLYDSIPDANGNWPDMWNDQGSAHIAWRTRVPYLICPSDNAPNNSSARNNGPLNYCFCSGDTAINGDHIVRGLFGGYHGDNGGQMVFNSFGSVPDGSSNTIAVSEMVVPRTANGRGNVGLAPTLSSDAWGLQSPGAPVDFMLLYDKQAGEYIENHRVTYHDNRWRATMWYGGSNGLMAFATVLPPNNGSFTTGNDPRGHVGLMTSSSNHTGGVNALLLDGSVQFISETVSTGSGTGQGLSIPLPTNAGGPRRSPYGVWGGLGTINGGESVSL